MNITKRVLSVALAVVFSMTSYIFSYAASGDSDYIFELTALGIIKGDENGNLNEDAHLTRAEFCAIIMRMRNLENVAHSAPDVGFADVSSEHWAKDYINFLASEEIVCGTGDGKFNPEGTLSWEDATKILVNILGYAMPAMSSGGYPSGYVYYANRLGLLDNVDVSMNPLPRREAFKMVYNALDIDLMVKVYGSEEKYEIQHGNTLREAILSYEESQEQRGVVTATIDTWIDAPVPGMTDKQIEIDGILYNISDSSLKTYLGMEVDFYTVGKSSRTSMVTAISPTENNTIVKFDASHLDYADSSKIYWFESEKDTKSTGFKWGVDTVIIKNNAPLEMTNMVEPDVINEVVRGEMTLIDNDNDKCADVVIIKEPTDVIVEQIVSNGNKIVFKDGFKLYGKTYFEFEPSNDEAYISFTDAEGNNIDVNEISEGDVISGFENQTGHRYELILGKTPVEGVIDEVSSSGFMLGSIIYPASDRVKEKSFYAPANTVKAYINYLGECVYMTETISDVKYAYVAEVGKNGKMGDLKAKLFLPATLVERYEEQENEDGGENTTVSKLFARNSSVEVFDISSKLVVDGAKLENELDVVKRAIEGKAIIYQLNSENEIVRIRFPKEVDSDSPSDGSVKTDSNKTYNANEMTFGKTSRGAFGVSESTQTICIPSNTGALSTDDYLVGVEMYGGRQYSVKAFDKNEDTNYADLIIISAEMKAGTAGIISSDSDVGFVCETSLSLDENGDEICKITLMTNGEKTTFEVSGLIAGRDSFKNIKTGELISYSTDLDGRLNAYKSLSFGESLSLTTPTGMIGGYTAEESFSGYLADAEFNIVSNSLNRWVHNLSLCTEPSGKITRELSIYKYSSPDIVMYNTKSQEAEFVDIKEINLNSDKIYVAISNSTVKMIVILR